MRDFSAGNSHSLVLCSPRDDPDRKMVFSLGHYESEYSFLGIQEEDAKDPEKFVHHLDMFDHVNPVKVEAGYKTSFVVLKG